MDQNGQRVIADTARALAQRLRIECESIVVMPFAREAAREEVPAAPAAAIPARPPVATIPARSVEIRPLLEPPREPAPDLPWTLEDLEKVVAECRRCPLHAQRQRTVFGEGSVRCEVMFVGEGPGAEEDATGRPFVGRAGQLLDRMIAAMGLTREACYIGNVVKCRPPFNATPTPDQASACRPYLERQIVLIRPRILVALGRTAAVVLTGRTDAVARLRGTWFRYEIRCETPQSGRIEDDIPVRVTYHPAALLRNPAYKPHAWQDLQQVMARLGRPVPQRPERPR